LLQNKTESLTRLCTKFFTIVPETLAIVIADLEGQIIHSQPNLNLENYKKIQHENLASIIARGEPKIRQIRVDLAQKKFGTAVYEVESYRFVNIFAEAHLMTFILSNSANADAVYPYTYLAAGRIIRILNKQDQTDTRTIPQLSKESMKIETIPKNPHFHFKFIIVGVDGTGKTSLGNKFAKHTFAQDYRSNIGLNAFTHNYRFLGFNFQFMILALTGQEQFEPFRRVFSKGASGVFILFDLTRRDTFDAVTKWKTEIDRLVPHIPCCIIGNKLDLTEKRQVQFKEGILLAEQLGASYIETSATTGANVEDAFALMSYKVLKTAKDERVL
jgi:small GTP-binding protein